MKVFEQFPWAVIGGTLALSSCSVQDQTFFMVETNLYEYVKSARLKYDNDVQKGALKQFFEDLLEMSSFQVHAKRWPNDKGVPNQWTAPQVFERYVQSNTPGDTKINMDTFYNDLNDMRVKSILVFWAQNLDGNMKDPVRP